MLTERQSIYQNNTSRNCHLNNQEARRVSFTFRRLWKPIGWTLGLLVGLFLLIQSGNWWFAGHQVLYNANVITLEAAMPEAEAVVIRRGQIAFIGSSQAAIDFAPWVYRRRDLQGRTLMPGFVDAHSHFLTTGMRAITTDLSPGPDGAINSLEMLYARLRRVMAGSSASDADNSWLLGFNYDNTAYPSGAHPDRRVLDSIAPHRKIFLRHNSGHMGVGNSAALRDLLGEAAVDPAKLTSQQILADPHIGKYPGSQELNGLLQEHTAPSLTYFQDQFSIQDYWRVFNSAVTQYAESGYTTVQNGTSGNAELRVLQLLSRLRVLPLRVVAWASHHRLSDDLAQGKFSPGSTDTQRFSIAAVKIILDGSPQGYTAWLSKPYHVSPGNDATYRGRGLYSDAELSWLLQTYYARGWRVAVHANGDAAIDQLLRVMQALVAEGRALPLNATPHTILVHAQTIRDDQLGKLADLGVTPSYFATHTYYWGDWHQRKTLGPSRARRISPLLSSENAGLRYSIHSDAPVTPPSALMQLWNATQRLTSSGLPLGPEERVSRESALRALTIEPAWQNGIDAQVGSLRVGKQADLVELSANPLLIEDIRRIKVVRTMVAGRTVFTGAISP